MAKRYTIAELKTMDKTVEKRLTEIKQELTDAAQERLTARADMEKALKTYDTKAYRIAANKEEMLTRKIEGLSDAYRKIDIDGHPYNDTDVINAWKERAEVYSGEMRKMLSDYRKKLLELQKMYSDIRRKEDEMLYEMDAHSELLRDKPSRYTTPLRDSISVHIPDKGPDLDGWFGPEGGVWN